MEFWKEFIELIDSLKNDDDIINEFVKKHYLCVLFQINIYIWKS